MDTFVKIRVMKFTLTCSTHVGDNITEDIIMKKRILGLFLIFSMMLGIVPTSAANNLTIEVTTYQELTDAISHVTEGQTILVMNDIALMDTLTTPENANDFTIDLNGNTISASADALIHKGTGTLTIAGTGGGVLTSTGEFCTVIHNETSGILEIVGATVQTQADGGTAILNNGTLTVSNGTVQVLAEHGTAISNEATLTITGGVVKAVDVGVAIETDIGSTVTISGGLVQSEMDFTITARGAKKITISGDAKVTSQAHKSSSEFKRATIHLDSYGNVMEKGVLEIKGGIVENTASEGEPYAVFYNIYSGVTEDNVNDYYIHTGGTVGKVFPEPLLPAAAIDDVQYETLQEAVDAVLEGQTITVLKDIDYTGLSGVDDVVDTAGNNNNFTIDLNGKVLSFNTDGQAGIFHAGAGELTIKDSAGEGKITSDAVGGSAITNSSTGAVIILGGTFESTASSYEDMSCALANLGTGTLKLEGSDTLAVATGHGSLAIANVNVGDVHVIGATVRATQPSSLAIGNQSTGKITIQNSATITSQNASPSHGTIYLMEVPDASSSDKVVLSVDGTVENTASTKGYAIYYADPTVDGLNIGEYYNIETPNRVGKIYPKPAEAKIGQISYATLQEAVDAAVEQDTIVLLSNINLTSTVNIEDDINFTMDLAGHTVEGIGLTLIHHQGMGKLTITDDSEAGDGRLKVYSTSVDATTVLNSGNGEVYISGGTIEADSLVLGDNSGEQIAMKNHLGIITVDGGEVLAKGKAGAILNVNEGTINIVRGKVESEGIGVTLWNDATGIVNISGGSVLMTTTEKYNHAIINIGGGTVNISGGTVSSTAWGGTVINWPEGVIHVSGGTVSKVNQFEDDRYCAIASVNSGENEEVTIGKIIISGTAMVTSDCAETEQYPGGTICFEDYSKELPTSSVNFLEVRGGTVENTVGGNAVYFQHAKITSENVKDYYTIADTATVGKIYPSITYTIHGKVIDKDTKEGLAATINLLRENYTKVGAEIIAGEDGTYIIPDVPEGTYIIEIGYENYKTETITGVIVNNANIIDLNAALIKEYEINIIDGEASAYFVSPGDTITITADMLHDQYFEKWTSTTEGVIFENASRSQTTFIMPAEHVTIAANFKARQTGTINGQVTDENGNPIEDAAVEIMKVAGFNSYTVASVTTDAQGDYSITDIPYGVYSLVVSQDTEGRMNTYSITVKKASTSQNAILLSGDRDTAVEVRYDGRSFVPTIAVDNLEDMFIDGDGLSNKVEIKLLVKNITQSNPSDQTLVEENLGSKEEVGIYLDAKLIKTINGIPDETVQPPAGKSLSIVIDLPSELQNKGVYKIIRVHDGEVEKFDAQYNSTYHTLTFKADKFSTYAIVYATQTVPEVPDDGSSSGGSSYTYYDIKIIEGENGNITPDGGTDHIEKVRKSSDKTFTFKPDQGYEVNDVMIDGKSVGAKDSYTFKKITSSHTLKVTFKKTDTVKTDDGDEFEDVKTNAWFYESVVNAVEKGWFTGTSTTKFSPYLGTTRGMIVTVLHRMEQSPAVSTGSVFEDVVEKSWYYNSVIWAQQNEVVRGYSNGKYGPNDNITREQMAAILYRYAGFKGYDLSKRATLNNFTDESQISNYAIEAVQWAVANELISGKDNHVLDPKGNATRAEVATILTRFDRLFVD